MRITKQLLHAVIQGVDQMVAGYVHPTLPGLAVVQTGDRFDRHWLLIHTNSGLHCGSMLSKRIAIRTLRELIAAGVNWTLDRDALRDTYGACHLRGLIDDAIAAARDQFRQRRLFPRWA